MMDRASRLRIIAVVRKELTELRRNRAVLTTATILPTVLTMVAVGQMLAVRHLPPPHDARSAHIPEAFAGRAHNTTEATMMMMAQLAIMLFLLVPSAIPSIMAAHAIIGEKTSRSLEPLLATPIRTWELVTGKMLACIVPGVLPSWIAYAVYATVVHHVAPSNVFYFVLAAPKILTVGLLGPLLSVISVSIAMSISSRVTEVQSAQSLSGLLGLPIVGLGIAQMTGVFVLSVPTVLTAALILFAVDIAAVQLCASLFERETILTRWK